MVRLKFLVFAVIALGAGAAQLVTSAPAHSDAAVEEGARTAAATAAWGRAHLDGQLSQVAIPVLNAVGTPDTLTVASSKGVKPAPAASDRLTQLRESVLKTFTDETRRDLGAEFVFAFASADGQAFAQGADGAVQTDGALPVAELAKVGPSGLVREAFGKPHLLFALPVYERGTADAVGTLVLGAPVLRAAALADAPHPIALVDGDKILAVGGFSGAEADPAVAQRWVAALGSRVRGAVEHGAMETMGPLAFPLFTSSEGAPRVVASRLPVKPYQLIAFTRIDSAQQTLAAAQKRAVMTLGGLLIVALLFTALMTGGAAKTAASTEKAPAREKKAAAETGATSRPSATVPTQKTPEPMAVEPAVAAIPAPPEATPEDFTFGDSAQQTPAPLEASGESEETSSASSSEAFNDAQLDQAANDAEAQYAESAPSESSEPEFPLPPPPPVAEPYTEPAESAPAEAFGQSSQAFGSAGFGYDDNPEATRVAAVPAELLAAAAHAGGSADRGMNVASIGGGMSSAPAVAAFAANPEESHFQEIFRDFVATRERCGEPADGLTFDKFSAKLRKNKEQLVAKHNCKTVRFQVYVKEGKAALKATPIAK